MARRGHRTPLRRRRTGRARPEGHRRGRRATAPARRRRLHHRPTAPVRHPADCRRHQSQGPCRHHLASCPGGHPTAAANAARRDPPRRRAGRGRPREPAARRPGRRPAGPGSVVAVRADDSHRWPHRRAVRRRRAPHPGTAVGGDGAGQPPVASRPPAVRGVRRGVRRGGARVHDRDRVADGGQPRLGTARRRRRRGRGHDGGVADRRSRDVGALVEPRGP